MLNNGKHKIVMLLLGPILGLAYVILLPFITIATVITVAVEKAVVGMLGLAGATVPFEWRPTTAYLTGKKRKKKG
ncbi:hypothetical protein BMS3Abin07_00035 [bacterium BMS3Abin07]|nr:hypothetical protein BMS3Abin07_00035 [bacterium BMS3Abin07]